MTASPAFLSCLLFLPSTAPAASSPAAEQLFEPVTTRHGSAVADWTELELRLSAQAAPVAGARGEVSVVEQQARTRLGPRMLEAAGQLRLDHETTAGDLMTSGEALGNHLDQESSSWNVVETRFFTSGRVEVDGVLDLAAWLKPVRYTRAQLEELPASEPSSFTGILLDARGLDAEAALAPRILSPQGEQLYGLDQVLRTAARVRHPVRYVSDPADPRALERAGTKPLILQACAVENDVDLVLPAEDAIRFATTTRDARLLAEARVVVVLDP